MLPSRSRLESWNPDALSFTGPAVRTAGDSVEQAVDRVNANLKIMPETKAWRGSAHDAASEMFDRAHHRAAGFSDCTGAIAAALGSGAHRIGEARKALLDRAEDVDRGPLNVSEGWVVLIDPGSQSADEISDLLSLAATEQAAINQLLTAVDESDTATADAVMAAAKPFGFTPPGGGLPGLMLPGVQRPSDDVPNPNDPLGLLQQAMVRGEDMGTTVRETRSGFNEDGHFEKTLIMQDGSKHIVTEYEEDYARGVSDMVKEQHFDADGNLISWSTSTRSRRGYNDTIMNWADGTQYVVKETPEGVVTASINLPDGRQAVIPADSPLLTSVPDRIGDVLTGVEVHVEGGGRIPMLSMDTVEKVSAGAKYGGMALGTMSAMYDFLRAPTPADKCVSVFAGTFGLAGNAVGAAGGAAIGAPIPIPGSTVGVAILTSVAAGSWMTSVGTRVGEVLCGS